MKDIEDFVNMNVKIEYMPKEEAFGYYPFHAYVENEDSTVDFICIARVNGVQDCYKLIAKYVLQKAKRIYMALDFPANGDIQHDFVTVFKIEGKKFHVFAIPYNTKTGETYPRIKESNTLFQIVKNLQHFATEFKFEKQFNNN